MQQILGCQSFRRGGPAILAAAAALVLLAACEPTVRVEAPREPITINLNVKLDADVRVRLEETARKDITSNPDIF
ncbi:YnbE family lipoprotein [Marinibaculum pumilum]|uniref:YnbE family lipoprotein n=1 Tax=Marinibaculum pumilum TaxID=1766165 RepID=A0ABV7L8J7_9PROT